MCKLSEDEYIDFNRMIGYNVVSGEYGKYLSGVFMRFPLTTPGTEFYKQLKECERLKQIRLLQEALDV